MAKIDKIKSNIEWLRELFKVLVAILVADVAGISKLYLDNNIGILFYFGVILVVFLSLWILIVAKRIEANINSLEDL